MKKITLLFTALMLATMLNATVYYISPGGSGDKTGLDWENAADLSTTTLALGSNGDEFWVKAGEYQVNVVLDIRSMYGGFNGTETQLSERDWVKNKTIIKGTASATAPLIFQKALEMEGINFLRVIDGFILQDNQNSTANGGGVSLQNKGVLRNCIIRNNSVGGANVGGGVFVDGVIKNDVYPTIENCLIINNAAANNGGGVQVANGRVLRMINSTVANNRITKETSLDGSGFGCGIGLPVNANLIAENCIVYNNSKPNGEGTLVFSFGANKGMNNNVISTVRNGAYDAINAGNGTQNGVVFAEKTACIDDLSTEKTPGFTMPTTFYGAASTSSEEYAEFAWADYRLLATSICIDQGNNTFSTQTTDLANKDRIYNHTIDIGAYERGAVLLETLEIPAGVTKSASAYTGGDIIFYSNDTDGIGQLVDIPAGGLPVLGKVKLVKTFVAGKWYAMGFPFKMASVRCDNPTFDYDLETFKPESEVSGEDRGDYWLKIYDGDKDKFDDYTSGATEIDAGGYALQVPAALDGATFTFTSADDVILSNSGELEETEDGYHLMYNPSVAEWEVNNVPNYYYAFEIEKSYHFGLIEDRYTLKPFESVIVAKNIEFGALRSSMSIETATALPALDLPDEKVVSTEYYNLQGMKITQPDKGNIYLIKKVFESGKTKVIKVIK